MERSRKRSAARRCGLGVEGLESRELLSSGVDRPHHVNPLSPLRNVPPPAQASQVAGRTMTPIPSEQNRSTFGATLTGSYVVAPGQFREQSSQTLMYLRSSAVMNGLHKTVSIQITTPTEPGMPIQAMAVLQAPHRPPGPASTVHLTLTPALTTESRVLPTLMYWTVDGSASTGTFQNATGQGVVALTYSNNPGPGVVPGTTQRGSVTVHFSGQVSQSRLALLVQRGGSGG